MNSDKPNTSPVPRYRRCRRSYWRLTIRFRQGEDDDLIAYLRSLPSGRRAGAIRQAVRQAVRKGLAYDGYWVQGPRRAQADVRVTVRFRRGRDDPAIAYLQRLPSRKRSAFVRQVLRASLQPSPQGCQAHPAEERS